ncbi:hypothetical protein [Haladaptatus sp. DJG-WS-42]|uniref:hypothetical protein n=1 Tax=Haladaptatus sp. DJG-WS-42 TaxID=3120516 RepID=UPI0030CDFBD4
MKQRMAGVKVAHSVIRSPETFYANLEPGASYRFPLIYAAASAVLGGIVLGGMSLVFEVTVLTDTLRSLSTRIFVFGLLGYLLFLGHTLGTHVVAVVFGAHGFHKTVEAMAYPTILILTCGWIPGINLIVGLYGLSLQVTGLSRLHKLNRFLAGTSVVLGGVFGLIFVFVLASLIGALVVA